MAGIEFPVVFSTTVLDFTVVPRGVRMNQLVLSAKFFQSRLKEG